MGNRKGGDAGPFTACGSPRTNALTPLSRLSKLLSNNRDIDLTFFEMDGKNVVARFNSSAAKYIATLKEHLENIDLPDKDIAHQKGAKSLELKFRGN